MNDIRRMTVPEGIKSNYKATWERRTLVVIVVGILLRFVMTFLVVGSMPQMGDGPAYVEQARKLLSGTVDHFYFPPGTALFTLPVFALAGFSTFSQHLAGFAIGVFFLMSTVFLARTILPAPKAVFVSALIAALYPHVLLSTAQISSLPLAAALVSVAMASGMRAVRGASAPWWLACALACGSAILVRPGTLLLPVVIIAMAWFAIDREKRTPGALLRPLVIMGAGVTALCLPVGLFHASGGHGMTLATNSEWNILLANNAHTPDYKTGHFGQRAIADLDTAAQSYIRQFFTTETAEPASSLQRQAMMDSATAYMINHPVRTLWRISNRVRGFFGCDYTAAREMQLVFGYSDRVFAAVMVFEAGVYLLVLLGWLLQLVFNDAGMGLARGSQIAVLLAIMAPHVLAFSLAKYHLPVVPVMICAAAAVISNLQNGDGGLKIHLRKRRKTLIIIALAVALVQLEHLLHLVWYR